ncbi:hypothetical protein TA3x_002303 [Tundrisphaera sp. TA3]|uniref:hypothetical protein n=1 Tax=Tundrisphaera sp. TA3 TaxID=3435775 RepID=UPI003EBE5F56
MKNPTAKMATGAAFILGGSGLLVLLYRRTAWALARTIPPGARPGWRTILPEQFKTYAEGIDSWMASALIVAGLYLLAQGYRGWKFRRTFLDPLRGVPTIPQGDRGAIQEPRR